MSKRILMLSSTWDSEYSKAVIAGIIERIGDDDIELHIFNAYDDLLEVNYYHKGREELETAVRLDPYNLRAKDALDRLIKKKFKDGKPKKGLFRR